MDRINPTTEKKTNPNIHQSLNPKSEKIRKLENRFKMLNRMSKFKSSFEIDTYQKLDDRFADKPPRGGTTFNTTFKLVNSHPTCQQCLYAFEIDTYGRGCVHDCVYCYAKDQLTSHGYWNRPHPFPVDITEIWKTFYTVFETDKKSKWRNILEKRVPLRIGSMSDSFMLMDRKYKVTQELLKLLDFYDYPYIVFTRSDLVASDEYMALMNESLCSIQMSLSSTNDELNSKIEPGAPSAKRRLKALEKLTRNGFWTTVRVNPFFPMYPDGYFTNPDFDRTKNFTPFEYSSFDMIKEIAETGCPSILAGFVRLSPFALNQIEMAIGRNLKPFFNQVDRKSSKDYHYSDLEVRAYYERIQAKCLQSSVQFTTCYIGNGENQFWSDQDLWSNKKDCCNAKGRVERFQADSREISWSERQRHTAMKCSTPNDPNRLNSLLGAELSSAKITGEEFHV